MVHFLDKSIFNRNVRREDRVGGRYILEGNYIFRKIRSKQYIYTHGAFSKRKSYKMGRR
jgi:hypothetical protein